MILPVSAASAMKQIFCRGASDAESNCGVPDQSTDECAMAEANSALLDVMCTHSVVIASSMPLSEYPSATERLCPERDSRRRCFHAV